MVIIRNIFIHQIEMLKLSWIEIEHWITLPRTLENDGVACIPDWNLGFLWFSENRKLKDSRKTILLVVEVLSVLVLCAFTSTSFSS